MSRHEIDLRNRLSMTEEELLMVISETQVKGLELHSPQKMLDDAREFVGNWVNRIRPILCHDGNLTSAPEWELAVTIFSILQTNLESSAAVAVSAYLGKRGVSFICKGYKSTTALDGNVT